jgi:hypothetical protein
MFLFCRFFLGPEWATRVVICDMFWHDDVHKPHMETSLGTKDEPRSTGPWVKVESRLSHRWTLHVLCQNNAILRITHNDRLQSVGCQLFLYL